VFAKWAWSGSREQFLRCGLRKFRHSKSSVYRWYTPVVRGRFVYDTYRTMEATRLRHGWVHMFITHWPTLTLQLHNFDLFRSCRTSSFCTVAWQLARFQLTRRIARSLGDSWASCWFEHRVSCFVVKHPTTLEIWSHILLSFIIDLYTCFSMSMVFFRAMLCILGTSRGPVSAVRLSVSLSVTSRSSTKTAKRRIT